MAVKILVLGAAGLIGGHVARELYNRGFSVRAFDRKGAKLHGIRDLKIEFMPGDLDDHPTVLEAMKGIDAVVHCAGFQPLFSNLDKDLTQALRETRNMIQAANVNKVKRILYVSCFSTLGFESGAEFANEDSLYHLEKSKSSFVVTKMKIETEILEQKHKGMDVLAVIPTATFGPNDYHPNTGRLIKMIGSRKMMFGVKGPVNVVDARDVAHGVFLALTKGKTGQRYILGGENTTWQNVIEQFAGRLSAKPPKVPLPYSFVTKVADFTELFAKTTPPIPRSGVDAMAVAQHVDDSKARRELEYESRPLKETLDETAAWFKEVGYVKPPKKGW